MKIIQAEAVTDSLLGEGISLGKLSFKYFCFCFCFEMGVIWRARGQPRPRFALCLIYTCSWSWEVTQFTLTTPPNKFSFFSLFSNHFMADLRSPDKCRLKWDKVFSKALCLHCRKSSWTQSIPLSGEDRTWSHIPNWLFYLPSSESSTDCIKQESGVFNFLKISQLPGTVA